jgi:hypothetical protein
MRSQQTSNHSQSTALIHVIIFLWVSRSFEHIQHPLAHEEPSRNINAGHKYG